MIWIVVSLFVKVVIRWYIPEKDAVMWIYNVKDRTKRDVVLKI
jgi:hypothetical protein